MLASASQLLPGGLGWRGKEKEQAVTGGQGQSGLRLEGPMRLVSLIQEFGQTLKPVVY